MLIKEICRCIEDFAPLSWQENYDNAGLTLGSVDDEVNKALICVDITMEIVEEAIEKKCDIIISHHPLIFKGIKSLNKKREKDKIIIKLIKENIAVYAAHTNIDNARNGVSHILAKKIGVKNITPMFCKAGLLAKLVCFCPVDYAENMRSILFEAGAGKIGNYDSCSFNIVGDGSFKAGEDTTPFVGKKGEVHYEKEVKIETIIEKNKQGGIIKAMLNEHPYEEVAFDIYPLGNENSGVGIGVIGELEKEILALDFLTQLKKDFNLGVIKHNKLENKILNKIAVCGGSGADYIDSAMSSNADIYISADFKYHDYEYAKNKIVLADIGHYESEQFTKELISNLLKKKIPTFAVENAKTNTNFIQYL
jgi:dinuclear metal center YbgI/SA1388 family protein